MSLRWFWVGIPGKTSLGAPSDLGFELISAADGNSYEIDSTRTD